MLDLTREVAAAVEAGAEAMEAAAPQMVVAVGAGGYRSDPFPICGFGWVKVLPGKKRALANALKRAGFSAAYPTGLWYWISAGGQSYDAKMAFARGMAAKLNELIPELTFYAGGRLD